MKGVDITGVARAPGVQPAAIGAAWPRPALDRLTRLACQLTRSPTALLCVVGVDGKRRFSRSRLGHALGRASRSETRAGRVFCERMADHDPPVIIGDARDHPALRGMEAAAKLGLASCLGVRLLTGSGAAVGALWVIDGVPRAWSDDELAALSDLGALAAGHIAARRFAAGRAHALRKVRESEARYRAVVEDQSELICRFLADTTITFVNGAYARYFGTTAGELTGRRWISRVPAAAQQQTLAGIAALEPNRPATLEHEVLLPDGSTAWQQWTNRAIAGADGGIVEYQAVGRDLTARRHLEDDLATAKAQLEDALACMVDGVALYDEEERFVLCNAAYHELFPTTADLRVPGAHMRDICREEARRGVYRGIDVSNVDAWMDQRREESMSKPVEEVELTDGRCLRFRVSRTTDGGAIVVASDVTAEQRQRAALEHEARHDPLTALANRATFWRALESSRERVARNGRCLAVMLVDLDRFKLINDTHGHDTGDALLIEVANRLRSGLRPGDLAARLGGDEFAVLAEGVAAGELGSAAARLVQRLAETVRLRDRVLRPSASLGFTVFPDDPAGAQDLLIHADLALYDAKAAGGGCSRLFQPAAEPAPAGAPAPIHSPRRSVQST